MVQAGGPRRNTGPSLDEPFALKSLARSEPPAGADSDNWHRYVITQGNNTIVGQLQGSRASAERAVKTIIDQLNERRLGKSGRVHQGAPGRKKKDAEPPPAEE